MKICRNRGIKMIAGSLLALLLSSFAVTQQEAEFSASAPSVVTVGQQFRLTYSMNFSGSNMKLPDLGSFRLIHGPGTSSSSSVSIVNGQRTQTLSVTYTYVLQATETGNFTLGPATVEDGSGTRTSNSLTIEVVADSGGRSQVPVPGPQDDTRQVQSSGEDIFVRVLLDREEVFQGEGVVATIKLYSKLDLSGIENTRLPSFSGFYQQDLETPPLRSLGREVINGEVYGTGVLRQVILFPQRNGEISIEPFEMDALVRQRTTGRGSLFDDFFGGFETRRIPVKSPPLKLNVKPLPGPAPHDFTGGVGNFTIDAGITPAGTRENEAVTLRLTVSGKGNLKLLGKPKIDFPPGFEVYDPGIKENISNSTGGQQGSITWEYLMIPRTAGNFRIPPVRFSYFDPAGGRFRSLSSGELSLLVERGEGADPASVAAGTLREDIRVLGSDIRHIKTTGTVLRKIGYDPYGSFTFYLWYIVPVVILTVFVLLRGKNIRDKADKARMRTRMANKIARRRLKTAGTHLRANKSQPFFEETLRATWGYLSDRLLIPVSELNRQNAKFSLLEKGIAEQDVQKVIATIEECEFARYAPSSPPADMNRIYDDAISVIAIIEQNIDRNDKTW